jgi:hypothetical protein
LLLKLQGRHISHVLKLPGEAGGAHSKLFGQVLNPNRLIVLVLEPFDGAGDVVVISVQGRNLTQTLPGK